MKRSRRAALVIVSVAVPASATASETVDYVYDALGRLTDGARTGGPGDGAATAARYDPAGNRTSYSVTGAGPLTLSGASLSPAATDSAGTLEEPPAAGGGTEEAPTAEEVPAAPVDAPAGIPDEAEPVVAVEAPEGGQ